jgi:hypothetical protein
VIHSFKVGDLVRDSFNEGENSYGLGIVVSLGRLGESLAVQLAGSIVYAVYFTKFKKTITFHGCYLEKI